MKSLRVPTSEEIAVIRTLLESTPGAEKYIPSLTHLLVCEMDDGGMGSRLLIPRGATGYKRMLGSRIASAEFTDNDGVLVSVVINGDNNGLLYELDMWKVDFSPLRRWPGACDIRFRPAKEADGSEEGR